MRDGQHAAAGLVLVGGHPLPEVARIVAAERRIGRVGLDAQGLVAAVAVDHVAMQVVALVERGPLVADESGEAAGIVSLLGGLDDCLPRRS